MTLSVSMDLDTVMKMNKKITKIMCNEEGDVNKEFPSMENIWSRLIRTNTC
jgi:hypothetical protein